MRIQQKLASYEKIRKWKTGLISQVDGSKVVYLIVYLSSVVYQALLKANFHLYVKYYVT